MYFLVCRSLISYVKINSKSMNWKRTTRRLFQEAVRSFRNTNEDLVAKDDDLANKTDFHRVRKLCEVIILKKVVQESSPREFFKRVLQKSSPR